MERLRNEIKSLKASMPIAGSLVDTYFYIKTSSNSYSDGQRVNYTARFIPVNPADGLGITEMSVYCEALASTQPWVQDNPVYLDIDTGYYTNGSGEAQYDGDFVATGYGSYTVQITVAIYSTVPGSIQIDFS